MNKEIQNKLMEIMGLAYEVSTTKKQDIFVDYSGHTNEIAIRIYTGGWSDKYADLRLETYLDDRIEAEVLENVMQILKTYL